MKTGNARIHVCHFEAFRWKVSPIEFVKRDSTIQSNCSTYAKMVDGRNTVEKVLIWKNIATCIGSQPGGLCRLVDVDPHILE